MYEQESRIEYFSGQGRLLMQEVDPATGLPLGKPFAVSNVPDLQIKFDVSKLQRKESMTGNRLTSLDLTTETKCTFEATLESLSQRNLQLACYAKEVKVNAGNFAGEFADDQEAGDLAFLPHPKVSSLTISDSASTPVVLTIGTHYEVDPDFGTVQFKDVSGFTQPLTFTGSHESYSPMPVMSDLGKEFLLRFQGLNTVNKEHVMVELYRGKPDPADVVKLISDEPTDLKLTGSVLADLSKESDETLGSMGRIIKLGAKTVLTP